MLDANFRTERLKILFLLLLFSNLHAQYLHTPKQDDS